MDDPVYLDHNATTPILPEVVDAMLPYFSKHFGNPSSHHVYGHRAHEALVVARGQVAEFLGCHADEVFFTSGGTEANNLAIRGVCAARPSQRHIVTSCIEHPATEMPCRHLETGGYEVTRLGVDTSGQISAVEAESALRGDTALVSIAHANSETGSLQAVEEIASIAHRYGAVVHTDAAQSAGKILFSADTLGVDLISLVGHKMYAPKGVGALFVRRGTAIAPQMLGGGHEQGLRSGTENVPCIVGLGKACEIALQTAASEAKRLRGLRDWLWQRLKTEVEGLELNGHPVQRLPNTLNIRFPGVSGNAILSKAPQIAASTGSACHADKEAASAVILAMGLTEAEAIGSVRLTLGRSTTREQVETAADALAAAYRSALRN